jgi:hypothetical protein
LTEQITNGYVAVRGLEHLVHALGSEQGAEDVHDSLGSMVHYNITSHKRINQNIFLLTDNHFIIIFAEP